MGNGQFKRAYGLRKTDGRKQSTVSREQSTVSREHSALSIAESGAQLAESRAQLAESRAKLQDGSTSMHHYNCRRFEVALSGMNKLKRQLE